MSLAWLPFISAYSLMERDDGIDMFRCGTDEGGVNEEDEEEDGGGCKQMGEKTGLL